MAYIGAHLGVGDSGSTPKAEAEEDTPMITHVEIPGYVFYSNYGTSDINTHTPYTVESLLDEVLASTGLPIEALWVQPNTVLPGWTAYVTEAHKAVATALQERCRMLMELLEKRCDDESSPS
jgi:hypothetical protein